MLWFFAFGLQNDIDINQENFCPNSIVKSSNSKKKSPVLKKFLAPIEIIDYGYEETVEYGKICA